jgi:signal transduction histidine kinase
MSISGHWGLIRWKKINWKTLSNDIGGKHLANRRSLLLVVPFVIAISVLSNSTAISDSSMLPSSALNRYLGLIFANIASIAVCWLYIEIVDRTLFRKKVVTPIKLHWVLLFGAGLGFLKGYTTGLFSWLVGSESDLALAISSRVMQTTLIGLWTIPLVAIMTATFVRFQNERQILLAESLEQGLQSRDSLMNLDKSSEQLKSYLAQAKAEVSALRDSSEHKTSNQMISQKLRDLVETGLRPISHKIWQENSKASGVLKISQLVKLAVNNNPFPIRLVIVGLAIGLFPITLSAFPVGEALARALVMLALTALILALVKPLSKASRWSVWINIVIAGLVSTFVSLMATDAIFDETFESVNITTWVSFFLWQVQLTVFSSVVYEVVSTRAQMRQRLIESLGKYQLDSEVSAALGRIRNRELAQYIHGNIQNKLLSFALKFDQDNLSTDDVSRLLDEVENLLLTAVGDYQNVDSADLDKQLAKLVQRWSGFVGIDLKNRISSSVLSGGEIKSIVEAVSEAVSNAVRHGLSKNLTITLEKHESIADHIEIVVEDDGLGPRSGKAGLGTELFNATSGVEWSLTAGKTGGSVLRVRIKTQPKT